MQSSRAVIAVLAAVSAIFSVAAAHAEDVVKAEHSGWDMKAPNACPPVVYPEVSRRNEETGLVLLSFHIGADGRVLDAELARPSFYPMLVEASRTALMSCVFQRKRGAAPPPASELQQVGYVWKLETPAPAPVAPKP